MVIAKQRIETKGQKFSESIYVQEVVKAIKEVATLDIQSIKEDEQKCIAAAKEQVKADIEFEATKAKVIQMGKEGFETVSSKVKGLGEFFSRKVHAVISA
jgi:hypothetical protein